MTDPAAVPDAAPSDLRVEIAGLAMYAFTHHGDDAAFYNALADLAGPDAMRVAKAPSMPLSDE